MKGTKNTSTTGNIFRKSSMWEEVKLHIWPIIGTLLANILWQFINPIIKTSREDGYIFEQIFFLPAGVYLFVSGYTLNKLVKEKACIENAWKNNSRSQFEKYRDERISTITHGFLTALSFMIMYIIYACPLQPYTGHLFVTTSSLIILYGWAWARELDDPFNGIYKLDIVAIEEKWPGVCNGYKKK